MTVRVKVSRADDPRLTASVRRRFEKYTCPEPNTGCLLWLACLNSPRGYGEIGLRTGELISAHRLAWLLSGRDVADGHQVLHSCDTPTCCNFRHLFIGTTDDNMRDMAKKRRGGKSRLGLPLGVSRHGIDRYQARVHYNKKMLHLGTFGSAQEAAEAVNEERRRLYGFSE